MAQVHIFDGCYISQVPQLPEESGLENLTCAILDASHQEGPKVSRLRSIFPPSGKLNHQKSNKVQK